jgi:ATP/maltotriose-dependent transcriptional regulator MalT
LIKHLFVALPKQQEISSDNVRKAIAASCEAIARNYGLTHREGEVLVYLASGYSRPYIENTLCISGGTVRTHVNHIHQKLRIHSRQQLLDIVQEFNDLDQYDR